MKILENKKTEVGQRNGKPIDYKDLIRDVLNDVPLGPAGTPLGFTRSQLKDRDRIEKAVDDTENGQIILEDNDANNLKTLVQNMRWGLRHPDLLVFIEDVEDMKKVPKRKKKEESDSEDDSEDEADTSD